MAGRKGICGPATAVRKSRHGLVMVGRKTCRSEQRANRGGEEDQRIDDLGVFGFDTSALHLSGVGEAGPKIGMGLDRSLEMCFYTKW
jgi:hypothetical protein